jgi:hypothetical protein
MYAPSPLPKYSYGCGSEESAHGHRGAHNSAYYHIDRQELDRSISHARHRYSRLVLHLLEEYHVLWGSRQR